MIKKFDVNNDNNINFEEFKSLIDFLKKRPEIEPIFDLYKNRKTNYIHA